MGGRGDLRGRCVLVTGAASGIGRACALAFAAAGARVAAADVDGDGLTALGDAVLPVVADVREPAQVQDMVAATAAAFGRLDVAVNNAGVPGPYRPLWEYTEDDVAAVLAVDLVGVWRCLKFEARPMIEQGGGCVVVVSSMLAEVGMAENAVYTAAKHGVHGLTRAAALELAPYGVRVNAVAPGVTRTGMTSGVSDDLLADVPLGRIAEPDEIADAVLWLAGASYVTGSVVTVDGGYTARVLGFWGTASLSIGVMAPTLAMSIVGPEPARIVGRAAPLAFLVAGLVVLAVSAGFLRLSAEFASAGSVYAFVGGSIGPRAGAFTGATLLGTYLVFPWVSVAGITVFGGELLRLAGLDVDWLLIALAGWLVVGALAAGGLRPAVRALIAFEIVAVLLILALMAVVVAAVAGGRGPRGEGLPADVLALPGGLPAGALVLAATAAFLAFCGFEAAGSLGEETHAPCRAVPRAMLATIGLGTVFYVACVTVQSWGFGTDPAGVAEFAGSAAPLGELAARYAGPGLAAALHAVALVSAVGAGLGCVIVAVRMLFAFGRDGLLPRALGRVSARTGTPSVALVVEMGVGLVLVTGFRLAGAAPVQMFFVLATVGVLHLLVMYATTNLAATVHLRGAGARWPALLAPPVGALVAAGVLVQSAAAAPIGVTLVVAAWLVLSTAFALRRAS